ncbi:MAG: hypothetical protein ACE5ER_06370 [Nitrospinaceae bacterium]
MRDLKNNVDVTVSLIPAVYATNQAEAGAGVDLQGFDAAQVAFLTGAFTDGAFTPKVQESDDNSNWTDVAATELDGALAALAASTVQRAGYRGGKRYLRPLVTVSGATSGGALSAVVLRGRPHLAPVA